MNDTLRTVICEHIDAATKIAQRVHDITENQTIDNRALRIAAYAVEQLGTIPSCILLAGERIARAIEARHE